MSFHFTTGPKSRKSTLGQLKMNVQARLNLISLPTIKEKFKQPFIGNNDVPNTEFEFVIK